MAAMLIREEVFWVVIYTGSLVPTLDNVVGRGAKASDLTVGIATTLSYAECMCIISNTDLA